MGASVAGTFATGSRAAGLLDQQSGVLVVGSQLSGNMLLTLGGDITVGNSCKMQSSTNNGSTWSDMATYNSVQNKIQIAVTAGTQYRMVTVVMPALKTISYVMSLEN